MPKADDPTTSTVTEESASASSRPGVLARTFGPPMWRALGLGLAFGILTALSHAPFDWWWVGLVAPLPLVWLAVQPGMGATRAAFWAAIGTMPWWWWSHQWVSQVSAAGQIPLVIYLASWTLLFVAIGARVAACKPRLWVLTLPVIWVGLEYLRGSVVFNGYAWFLLGHPMILSPGAGLAQPAAWGGVYLVSALVLLGMCTLVAVLRKGRDHAVPVPVLAGTLGAWLIWLVLGLTVCVGPAASGEQIRVAVVQSNVPQSNKTAWTFTQRYLDWLTLRELTIAAAAGQPDLIVWPETMYPGLTLDSESVRAERNAGLAWPIDRDLDPRLEPVGDLMDATTVSAELLALQQELGIPMLIGAVGFEGYEIRTDPEGFIDPVWERQYNSVFVLRNGRVQPERYDKQALMAFGETMPYVSAWPRLEQMLLDLGAQGMSFTLDAGSHKTNFELPAGADAATTVRIVTPICFEAAMPWVTRGLVFANGERQAGLIVNPSNDGWFSDSLSTREHYLRVSRFRCIELRTPMVRACNTGISAAIDAHGRVITDDLDGNPENRFDTTGVLTVGLDAATGATLYARWGDWFGFGAAVLTGLALIGLLGCRLFQRTQPATGPTASETD